MVDVHALKEALSSVPIHQEILMSLQRVKLKLQVARLAQTQTTMHHENATLCSYFEPVTVLSKSKPPGGHLPCAG